MELLEWVCIIYAGSNLIFLQTINYSMNLTRSTFVLPAFGLLLGLANACLPMDKLNDMIFEKLKKV